MPKGIDRNEVQRLVAERNAQLVEVLPGPEYEQEHLPGAINIPLKELNRETAMQLDRSRPVRDRDQPSCWSFRWNLDRFRPPAGPLATLRGPNA
jgi:hypothetical protein